MFFIWCWAWSVIPCFHILITLNMVWTFKNPMKPPEHLLATFPFMQNAFITKRGIIQGLWEMQTEITKLNIIQLKKRLWLIKQHKSYIQKIVLMIVAMQIKLELQLRLFLSIIRWTIALEITIAGADLNLNGIHLGTDIEEMFTRATHRILSCQAWRQECAFM